MTVEEEEEDPNNINILETEGQREVEGPKAEKLDISGPLRTKKVNIGFEAEPKLAKIGVLC